MNKTVFDMVDILTRIEAVLASTLLSEAQKTVVLGEISRSLPAHQLCGTCVATYNLTQDILGGLNGSTKEATPKGPQKGAKVPKEGRSTGEKKELLRHADGNRRGKSTSSRVVNKAS